jgi:hypothetical protein
MGLNFFNSASRHCQPVTTLDSTQRIFLYGMMGHLFIFILRRTLTSRRNNESVAFECFRLENNMNSVLLRGHTRKQSIEKTRAREQHP